MKTKSSFRFTDLPSELRGAVGMQLDLSSLARLKMAAHALDRSEGSREPLLEDQVLDPLVAEALRDPTLREITRVVRERRDPFAPGALAELRTLRNDQHRDQLMTKVETMPATSDGHGRAKALQLIKDYAAIQMATRDERIALLGGRDEENLLPAVQRLALATDPATEGALLIRLAKNVTASVDECNAIAQHTMARQEAGTGFEALAENEGTSALKIILKRACDAAHRSTFLHNPATPPVILENLAQTSKNSAELLKIIAHPNTGSNGLQIIAKKTALLARSCALRAAIRAHTWADSRTLMLLAEKASDPEERASLLEVTLKNCIYPRYNADYNYQFDSPLYALAKTATDARERQALFAGCNGDTAVLGCLADTEKDAVLRRQFLDHPECDDFVLAGLVWSAENKDEFTEIFNHLHVGERTLSALGARLPDHHLRMRALQHPSLNETALERFAAHAVNDVEREAILAHRYRDRNVLTALVKSALTPQHRGQILSQSMLRTYTVLELAKTSTDPVERELLKTHPYTNGQVLAQLDKITAAPTASHIAAAENPATPQKNLLKRAKLATHALERLALAKNPSTPTAALDSLVAKVVYPAERLAIAKHPATSAEALKLLADNLLYAEEIRAVAMHLNADHETLQQMLNQSTSDRDRAFLQQRLRAVVA
ncbi:MAG: hypothetical protein V4695_02055 [Pseudomonadota bacterium]